MKPNATASSIEKAVTLLKKSELVAFPTETVYGLGGLATSPCAIQKIFKVKGRSQQKPLSLLIPNKTHLVNWVKGVSSKTKRLIDAFWPGPLTILLEPNENVLASITADSNRVGLRVPSHPVASALLSRLDCALATPSANLSGQLSATTASAVKDQLGNEVSLILEDDSCSVGIESTVIDMASEQPIIRRLGAVSINEIEEILSEKVSVKVENIIFTHGLAFSIEWVQYPFDDILSSVDQSKTVVLAYSLSQNLLPPAIDYIAMPSEPSYYQRELYQKLSHLKQQGYRHALIECLPAVAAWDSTKACLNRWCKSAILK